MSGRNSWRGTLPSVASSIACASWNPACFLPLATCRKWPSDRSTLFARISLSSKGIFLRKSFRFILHMYIIDTYSSIKCIFLRMYPIDTLIFNSRMDIREIRKENARNLLESECSGKIVCFAQTLGRPDSQVSQWIGKNAKKNIGQQIAREIDQAFNKPSGWLDQTHDSLRIEEIKNKVSRLSPSYQQAIEAIADILESLQKNSDHNSHKSHR